MGTPAAQLQLAPTPEPQSWTPSTRIAFRFCFVYFGLYCLTTQILIGLFPITNLDVPDPSTLWPVKQIVTWVAVHFFRVKYELVYFSGSGDKTFDWVLMFCSLVFSVVVMVLWSVLDRKRTQYVTLYKWFRLFIRFALAGQMFGYGLAKAIPMQMPFPYLAKLLEPYGNFSPMGVLWASVGASPAYEIFTGCAETLGGILLIFPRTTTLGTLICLADMVQVFLLNMTYDVPVKLLSFHLILVCLFLLAPDFRRLMDFFILKQPAASSLEPPLFSRPRRNRLALIAQIVFGLVLFGMNLYAGASSWNIYGGGQPKPALYGIWDVTLMTIDSQVRSPLTTDYDRWRRVIFDVSSRTDFQRMNDTFARYSASVQLKDNSIELNQGDTKKGRMNFQRPSPDRLILDGEMEGHKVRMELQRFDSNKFLLVSRGFHWVQEYPYNR